MLEPPCAGTTLPACEMGTKMVPHLNKTAQGPRAWSCLPIRSVDKEPAGRRVITGWGDLGLAHVHCPSTLASLPLHLRSSRDPQMRASNSQAVVQLQPHPSHRSPASPPIPSLKCCPYEVHLCMMKNMKGPPTENPGTPTPCSSALLASAQSSGLLDMGPIQRCTVLTRSQSHTGPPRDLPNPKQGRVHVCVLDPPPQPSPKEVLGQTGEVAG